MAEIPDGIQVLFDQFEAESSDARSDETPSSTADSTNVDYHREQYPSYVPPHKRGHNVQQDGFVNFKATAAGEADKKEGIDNDKYQRLNIQVPFALDRVKMGRLKADFPGVYFHCRDNSNHDHPFSHMVTMIGTRFMQRRIKPGKRVLDVYGNPNASDRFNVGQMHAAEPKHMKALVNRVGPADFIREVNKWGPFFDEDEGIERYHRGSLMSMVHSGEIEQYDVLQLVHTLYYIPFEDLSAALHAPGKKRVAYALVHKHALDKGSLNDGEQTYSKKFVGDVKLVRQVNVATNTAYVHPDLTDLLFSEEKVWLPQQGHASRTKAEHASNQGVTWELHVVNADTWIVEFVPYVDTKPDGVVDYAAMWRDEETIFDDDYLATPSSSESESDIHRNATSIIVPTPDGKFIELEYAACPALFNHLRMKCSGKERTAKLLSELIETANHLVNPSALFGDKPGMRCPPDKVYEVAVAAFAADIPKEDMITRGIACLRPVLNNHARNLKLGPRYKDLCLRDLMTSLRLALSGLRDVNRVVRSKDPIDAGLESVLAVMG